MSKALPEYDKETIIHFNKEENTAYIFTYEKSWQYHLEKKLGIKPTMNNGFGGKEYQIDKKLIPMPRVPKKRANSTRKKPATKLQKNRILSSGSQFSAKKTDTGKEKESSSAPLIKKEVVNALLRQ